MKTNDTFKIHDFRHGQTELIDWNPGDYTVHDYGRGGAEVGIILEDGRIWGIHDDKVPAEVWDFIDADVTLKYDEDTGMRLYSDFVNSLPEDSRVW